MLKKLNLSIQSNQFFAVQWYFYLHGSPLDLYNNKIEKFEFFNTFLPCCVLGQKIPKFRYTVILEQESTKDSFFINRVNLGLFRSCQLLTFFHSLLDEK